ncbi:hypothetical protein [Lacisediminimonas sp.]|uniref:hypothetical protein n=1 Tax=Lacisediminimonas sp. TaxID=3060582 RepID=UPI00272064B2|nr:hypothetical protein [Lacisediminimonas sp.]MDO8301002.1 hypothetical protein [Lacisediminimonas sp.]
MSINSNASISIQYSSYTSHTSLSAHPLAGFSAALSLPALIQRGLVDNEVLTSYLAHAQPQDLMHALHYTWGGPAVASISVFSEQVTAVRTATIGEGYSAVTDTLFKVHVSEHIIQYAGFSIRASFRCLTVQSAQVAVFARANLAAHAALDTTVPLDAARRQFIASEPAAQAGKDTAGKMFDQALSDNAEDHFPARAPALRPVSVPPQFPIQNKQVEALDLHRADRKLVRLEEQASPVTRSDAAAVSAHAASSVASKAKKAAKRAADNLERAGHSIQHAADSAKEKIELTASRAAGKAAKNAEIVESRLALAGHKAKLDFANVAFTARHQVKSAIVGTGRAASLAAEVIRSRIEWAGSSVKKAVVSAAKAGVETWVGAARLVADSIAVGATATARFVPLAAEVVRSSVERAGSSVKKAVVTAAKTVAGNLAGGAAVIGGAAVTVATTIGAGVAKAAGSAWGGIRNLFSRGFERV